MINRMKMQSSKKKLNVRLFLPSSRGMDRLSPGHITEQESLGCSRHTWFDCWITITCVCSTEGSCESKNWVLILWNLFHFHAVIAREIQITNEHTGLVHFAFNSANDGPSPPLSLRTAPPPLSLSSRGFYLQKRLLYSYSDSTIL